MAVSKVWFFHTLSPGEEDLVGGTKDHGGGN